MLGRTGLNANARFICEKPFGHDLASARALNATIARSFEESQVFRIDHFLGKESVDNILALRFANGLFEPIWNRDHVSYVQIDVPETLSIEGRAAFFEPCGAYRDMVVTHLFQLMGIVAMEPPTSLDARPLRNETVKVFDSMPMVDPEHMVRGQYEGYRSEEGVDAGLRDRDVRRAAHRGRQLALEGRALLPAHRQVPEGEPLGRHDRAARARAAHVPARRRGRAPCGATGS